ncbi:hypothetical protein V8E36_000095 [Tilletia maclaganii]
MSATSSSTTLPALPDPSLAPPALPASEHGFTAQDLINRQLALEREAHEACPFNVSRCTHASGPARQLVFSCRTCAAAEGEPKGVCAPCSVACHAEHDLVELFHRRNFRCDCGTSKDIANIEQATQPCTLREPPFAVANEGNRYDHNYDGEFCYCERGKTYNPHEEKEVMFQCLICEDWLHESCTSLKRSLPAGDDQTNADDIPSLLDHELFDQLICDACVRKHSDRLGPYLGKRGWLLCLPESSVPTALADSSGGTSETELKASSGPAEDPVRTFHDGEQSWKIFGLVAGALATDESGVISALSTTLVTLPAHTNAAVTQPGETGESQSSSSTVATSNLTGSSSEPHSRKRTLSPSHTDAPEAGPGTDGGPESSKRIKLKAPPASDAPAISTCRKPARPLLHSIDQISTDVRLDVFLTPTFRDIICRCEQCQPDWTHLPYLPTEEPTLSPPPTSTPSESGSTYSLGLAALSHLPRERMLTALGHYQDFRSKLFELLQPFAESGQAVDEETIRGFTARLMKERGGGGGGGGRASAGAGAG